MDGVKQQDSTPQNDLTLGFKQDDSIVDQDDFVIDPELEFVNDPLYKDQWVHHVQ
jgi:hypothetical protein